MSQRQISTTKSPFHLEGEGVWGWKLVFTPADVTNPVEQLTDYYPFGMAHQYTRPNNDNKYLYNQKELQDDVLSNTGLNWYDYGARFYDPQIGRWHAVDPLAEDYFSQSTYHFSGNNPINFLDLNGMNYNPIYGFDGSFLGTDDLGLQGDAIMMNKKDFIQGMSHNEASDKGVIASTFAAVVSSVPLLSSLSMALQPTFDKIDNHFATLPSRPDYDGYLTKKEADDWWLGKSGQPLFVDQSKIELPGISTKSFDNKEGSSFYENFVWGLSNTGKVYGTLKLTLTNAKTGTVHLGGAKYMDEYDFTMDGRWARDFATWWGRPGGKNDGKSFLIHGYGQATVPVKK